MPPSSAMLGPTQRRVARPILGRGPILDEKIVRAASWDEGNRAMRRAGRQIWSQEDWDVACDTYDRLMRIIEAGNAKF